MASVVAGKALSISGRSPAWERSGDDGGWHCGISQASKSSSFLMTILMSFLVKISEGWPKFAEPSLPRSLKQDTVTNNCLVALGLKVDTRSQLTAGANIAREPLTRR